MKKTSRCLAALALAASLGGMSTIAAPAAPDIQPQTRFWLVMRFCLSADENACGLLQEVNEFLIRQAQKHFGNW